jgi:hypothetical protein
MANWTTNRVMVYGSEEDIRNFKALVTNPDTLATNKALFGEFEALTPCNGKAKALDIIDNDCLFDFNRILPMPAELEGTTAPRPAPDQRLCDLYGADNWYDWRIKNWGTKWGAGCPPTGIRVKQQYDMEVEYFFQTAWNPPVGIYQALLKHVADRDLQIVWRFNQDPCEGQCGFLREEGSRRMWSYNPFHVVVDGEVLNPWEENQDEPDNLPDNVLTVDDDNGK